MPGDLTKLNFARPIKLSWYFFTARLLSERSMFCPYDLIDTWLPNPITDLKLSGDVPPWRCCWNNSTTKQDARYAVQASFSWGQCHFLHKSRRPVPQAANCGRHISRESYRHIKAKVTTSTIALCQDSELHLRGWQAYRSMPPRLLLSKLLTCRDVFAHLPQVLPHRLSLPGKYISGNTLCRLARHALVVRCCHFLKGSKDLSHTIEKHTLLSFGRATAGPTLHSFKGSRRHSIIAQLKTRFWIVLYYCGFRVGLKTIWRCM